MTSYLICSSNSHIVFMMKIRVETVNALCGAGITGVEHRAELDADKYTAVHPAWLDYQVLVFPDTKMTEDDQIRFTKYWGDMAL